MSRHRNVRSMNYSDEYDGYDDVYGHSVEDDYSISPSVAAFMFDRDGSRGQPKIQSFLSTENDIAEETEGDPDLHTSVASMSISDEDIPRLDACLSDMRNTLGTDISTERMTEVAAAHNFNSEKSINYLLDNPVKSKNVPAKNERDCTVSKNKFTVPKLNMSNRPKFDKSSLLRKTTDVIHIEKIPSSKFTSLSDFTNNHLQSISPNNNNSRNNFNTSNKPNFSKVSNNLTGSIKQLPTTSNSNANKVYRDLEKLNLSSSQQNLISTNSSDLNMSEKTFSSKIGVNFDIDLTKALKDRTYSDKHKITPKNNKQNDQMDFTPAFIACDDLEVKTNLRKELVCLDKSEVLSNKFFNGKKLSHCGKILCSRYKRYIPYVNLTNSKNSQFLFNIPSPDDTVLNCRRNSKSRNTNF